MSKRSAKADEKEWIAMKKRGSMGGYYGIRMRFYFSAQIFLLCHSNAVRAVIRLVGSNLLDCVIVVQSVVVRHVRSSPLGCVIRSFLKDSTGILLGSVTGHDDHLKC